MNAVAFLHTWTVDPDTGAETLEAVGPVAEWFDDNRDAFSPAEIDGMLAVWAAGGSLMFGGGAAPLYRVAPAPGGRS